MIYTKVIIAEEKWGTSFCSCFKNECKSKFLECNNEKLKRWEDCNCPTPPVVN